MRANVFTKVLVCFSPEGDLIGGLVVTAVGIDACLHLRGRGEYRLLAAFPIMLGLHQVDEALVWWRLQGHVPGAVGQVAMWIYLLFAFVALPVLVPAMVMLIEPSVARRWRMTPFLALGAVVSTTLLVTMVRGHPSARLGSLHVAYSIGLKYGIIVIGLYIVATCGPLLASGIRSVVWFGVANLVAVVVLARLCADGFASLWCFYAAITSGAIALHLRVKERDDVAPTSMRVT